MNDFAVALRSDIDKARPAFESVGDRSVNFEKEAGFAVQALMANDYIIRVARDNPQSVINAVTNIAAIGGISLNPAKKQAYLVPREGRICLDISYIGLLDLAIQSRSIKWGQSELVHEADSFDLNGFDKPPTHGRNPFKTDRGAVIGAYVVVKTLDGDYLTTTMTSDEILAIRDRSSAWKSHKAGKSKSPGPWGTDEGEMMKKTVIKRAYKLWPKTERLDAAIHHLNTDGDEGLPAIENIDPLDQPKDLGLTSARAKQIRAAASAALQKFNEDNEWGAFEEVSEFTDEEEMQALWSILRPHSALRASLKRSSAEQRKRDAELATNTIDNGDTGQPAAA